MSRFALRLSILVMATTGLLVATVVAASALTPSSEFGPTIDDYSRYQGQSECRATEQPGVQEFRAMLQRRYGANGGGIQRPCSRSTTSEHQDGRAYDWMLDARRASDRAKADEVLSWLLATDEHGNDHAMARRLGIMYIIWNRQIWKSWEADDGWQPYSGYSPHTDHIHFSFGWEGARRQTSYWTSPRVADLPEPTYLDGDFSGDGLGDVAIFDPSSGDWRVGRSGGSRFDVSTWSNFRTATGWDAHLVGDFTGNDRDDILSYHGETGRWWINRSTGTGFVLERWASFRTTRGWSQHLVGDFDGDGRADVASYHDATGRWWVSRSTGNGFETRLGATSHPTGRWQTHLAGDFDGDGRDGIVSLDSGNGNWVLHRSDGQGLTSGVSGAFATSRGWDTHLVGDFTGSGRDQVASYHPGAGTWWVTSHDRAGGLDTSRWATWQTRTGWSAHLAGDVHGDGRDDIISYHPRAGSMWVSSSTGDRFAGARWERFATRTGWAAHLLSDFDGSGRADVASFHPRAGSWWASRSEQTRFATERWAVLD